MFGGTFVGIIASERGCLIWAYITPARPHLSSIHPGSLLDEGVVVACKCCPAMNDDALEIIQVVEPWFVLDASVALSLCPARKLR